METTGSGLNLSANCPPESPTSMIDRIASSHSRALNTRAIEEKGSFLGRKWPPLLKSRSLWKMIVISE